MSLPGPVPSIDVTEAERRLRDDPDRPVLLDVREPDEFETVRAPGVLNIPMSTFQSRVGDVPTDRPVLVICHTGGRSAAVTGFLVRSGRTDVVNVAGGMEAWANAGLPTRSGTPNPGEGQLPG
jgi:rhodanese-related sulfurtransferase